MNSCLILLLLVLGNFLKFVLYFSILKSLLQVGTRDVPCKYSWLGNYFKLLQALRMSLALPAQNYSNRL